MTDKEEPKKERNTKCFMCRKKVIGSALYPVKVEFGDRIVSIEICPNCWTRLANKLRDDGF